MSDVDISEFAGDEPKEMEAMPAGKYAMIIESATRKAMKSGNGDLLEVVLQCIEGPHKGGKAWATFNLWHTSDKSVSMAQTEFAKVKIAIGCKDATSVSQLYNRPVFVNLFVDEYQGKLKNKVKTFEAIKSGKKPPTSKPDTQDGYTEKIAGGADKAAIAKEVDSSAPWSQ